MGAVWLGRDTVLGREVALKRIGMIPGATSPDLERAEREARLAARLNHPHVVAVFDLVTDDDGTWLVMEYVEGVTLAALVKTDGALLPDEAAPLVRQAADALTAAHGAGIVHRDVKPSNILVTHAGEVKLSDFGIARAEADASLTQTGLVTGSPAYLAPEVASGSAATEASDVWSLGATLFHALAGHPPYDVTDNLMGALFRIVHEEPPRLSNAGWLAPALEHTMAREPTERWSMQEVRDFLDGGHDMTVHPTSPVFVPEDETRILQPTPAEPMAVPPVSPDPEAPPGPRRRSPWPWVAAVVVVVAAAVIAVAALTSGGGGGTPSSIGPTTSSGTTRSSPSSPTSSSPSTAADAAAMSQFITSYLSTVTTDDHSTFDMLTPAYQQASGHYGGYHGFWKTIESATPSNVQADPANMTVSYDVSYVKTDGSRTTGHVTLDLVRHGASYLISGES
jgi:serine/threonine protein kinase